MLPWAGGRPLKVNNPRRSVRVILVVCCEPAKLFPDTARVRPVALLTGEALLRAVALIVAFGGLALEGGLHAG